MIGLEIGRILHIPGVVIWIGGLTIVTTVILPAVKKFKAAEECIEFFEMVESKFSVIAKIANRLGVSPGVLRRDLVAVRLVERRHLADRRGGDDHPGCVNARVADEALQGACGLESTATASTI